MKKQVIEETLKKIKREKIEPTPKWQFELKNFSVWAIVAILIVSGGVASGLLIYFSLGMSQEFFSLGEGRRWIFLWHFFPRFWLLILSIFFFLAFLVFRQTKHGYRYGTWLISAGLISLVIFIGSALYFSNKSEWTHECFCNSVPYYKELSFDREKVWSRPDIGFLGGKVLTVEENNLNLEDLVGTVWYVKLDDGVYISRRINLMPEMMIKIMGVKEAENIFRAEEIKPWSGRGKRKSPSTICPQISF